MPATLVHAGRSCLLSIAGGLCLLIFTNARSPAALQHGIGAHSPFEKAQRMREALEGQPERQRTRRDYERVADAYRAVYHGDPASAKADTSVLAVADLLAEEGRVFQDEKALRDAIVQYEFLRNAYPWSHYRFSALLTEGEIYLRDLNDRESARATFQEFLRLYPQNPLANEARIELSNLYKPAGKTTRGGVTIAQNDSAGAGTGSGAVASRSSPSGRHTVLTAAIQSQEQNTPRPVKTAPSTANAAPSSHPVSTAKTPHPPEQQVAENDISPPAQPPATEPSHPSEASLNAPPPPRRGRLPLVTGIRHWSTPVYTRVAIDLQDEVQYEAVRVPNPDRIFFDLHGARLSPELIGKADEVIDDGFLKQVRAAQFSNDVTRIVLDVSDVSEYSAFFLPNPSRLIIDVHGRKSRAAPVYTAEAAPIAVPAPKPTPRVSQLSQPVANSRTVATLKPTIGIGSATTPVDALGDPLPPPAKSLARMIAPRTTAHVVVDDGDDASPMADVASLSQQPNRVKATKRPTTAPVVQSVAGTSPAPQSNEMAAVSAPVVAPVPKAHASRSHAASPPPADMSAQPVHAAQPTADGQRSMVRALGLKINRIVVDAGHGGHDSGTLGPDGIQEKDVVLDVALRLGQLLKQRLGADVIYTRDDDTFIPLETRTAIANKAQADLFISVHANSSPDASARGVETYYLNFTTSADALEVAARENAVSDQSIHELSDLVKKIALQDKINESREFASDVDQSLYEGLEGGNPGLKDRGVKKAPFVVLIGANMPSILAEISFLTNPSDAQELRDGKYRERIAESLYHGVARYVGSLSGVRIADASPHGGDR
ncbi:MAG TPA: N-acetylmuramoyl-L-alanine amidase [Silvibacterium sp.]|nr:N-acetylmuramoyl-L-alanine amidase [Silvibacterium sp.]